MSETTTAELGKIRLGEKVVISDPCYELGCHCAIIRKDFMPGGYTVFARKSDEGDWGNRVSRLMAFHDDYAHRFSVHDDDVDALVDGTPCGISVEHGEIGVDAGCAGIYDYEYFAENQPDNDYYDHDSWFYRVTSLTNLENGRGGVMDGLCGITESGYGDGGYDVTFFIDDRKKQVVGVSIDFGVEDEEEEYYDDDYEDEEDEKEGDW